MILDSLPLARWAAPGALAATLLLAAAPALAQDDAAAPGTSDAAVPAEAVDPAATPAEAPTETPDVIPVETGEAEAAPEAVELDAVEVTGSRIKRSDYETAQPVLVIRREDIERTGLISIGDILQDLPQAGAALSRAFNNGGNGSTEIDLRNLGSNRVLVLVNGRRWVGSVSQFNTSGVDLNTIPISVIDSIEVLKDGASAVYGSDAIAGVINIKTRRDFVGGEARTHVDITDRGDGLQQAANFSIGTVAGATSIFFDVGYVQQSELLSADREETAVPVFGTGPHSRGSAFSPHGRLLFVPTPENASAINVAAGTTSNAFGACRDLVGGIANNTAERGTVVGGQRVPGTGQDLDSQPTPISGVTLCDITPNLNTFGIGNVDFVRFDQNLHAYNYAPLNYLITPQERTSIFGQVSHDLTDSVRLSSEVLYNVRKSAQELAPTPFAGGDAFEGVPPFDVGYLAATNPFNPTNPQSPYYIPGTNSQDIGKSTGDAGLVGLGVWLRRFNELGFRHFSQKVDTYRIGGGFDGAFDRFDRLFSWDAGYAFSENKLVSTDAGLLDATRTARATGPIEDCIDTDTTTAPLEATGCVPLDVVGGPGTLTQEMLDYIQYTAVDTSRQRQRVAYGNMSTELPELSQWLPGPAGIAVGFELREEFFQSVPDPLKAISRSSTNSLSATRGAYDAVEAYLELALPLLENISFDDVGLGNVAWLKGRSLVRELDISLAGRYSEYSGFGSNVSHKIGVRYKPIDDLMIRATASDAFRAPAITDLFLGAATSFPLVSDICRDRTTAQRANEPGIENVNANCTADGVPDTVSSNNQIATTFGGNPDLEPETAKTLSMGFVYSPSALPDFNMYLDWYSIDLEQFIGAVGPGLIQELCYRSPSDQRTFCNLLTRNPTTGALTSFNAVFQNFAALQVAGVDFNVDWLLPLPENMRQYGAFKWVLDAAYVSEYDVLVPSGLGDQRFSQAGFVFSPFGGGIPRWKVNTGLNWSQGPWEATWNIRYIHHVFEVCNDGRQNVGAAEGGSNPTPVLSLEQYGLCSGPVHSEYGLLNKLDATIYNDLVASYELPDWNARLSFGVNNILDQDPPPMRTAFADSYDKATYSPWGSRTPYLRLQVNF